MRRRTLLSPGAGATVSVAAFGRSDGSRPITSYDCPPYPIDPDDPEQSIEAYTICSHAVDPSEASTSARPSRASVGSVTDLSLVVHNDTSEPLTYDGWRLRRHEDGAWTELDSEVAAGGATRVAPGSSTSDPAARELARFGLTPPISGTFAASVMLSRDGGPPYRCIALFRIY